MMTKLLAGGGLLCALFDAGQSIDSCDTSGWVETSSTFSSSTGNRAASTLITEDCTILSFGGSYDNAIYLDTSESSPSWDDYSDITSEIEPFWPTTKGAMFMQYSNGTVDESYIYVTCDNGGSGIVMGFDVSSQDWTIITEDVTNPAEDCCAFALDDKIYVFGGQDEGRRRRRMQGPGGGSSSTTTYDNVQIYDIDGDSWSQGTAMDTAREDMGCEMMIDTEEEKGYVYVVGGAEDETVHDSIERYDIEDDSWTFYDAVLDPARRGMGVQYIKNTDIMVIIAGEICYDGEDCGDDGDNFLSRVDVFNITSGEIDDELSGIFPNVPLAVAGAMSGVIYNDDCGLSDGSISVYVMGGEYVTDETPSNAVSVFCWDGNYTSRFNQTTITDDESTGNTGNSDPDTTEESTDPATTDGGTDVDDDGSGDDSDDAMSNFAVKTLFVTIALFAFQN